jgi:hypothetical protein
MQEHSTTTLPLANKQPAPHVEQGIETTLEQITREAERAAQQQSTTKDRSVRSLT